MRWAVQASQASTQERALEIEVRIAVLPADEAC
jgi:hypothetical protein